MEKKNLLQLQDIRGHSYGDLVKYLELIGEKGFRATQIFEWIYQKNVWAFEEMKNLPQDLRDQLAKDFVWKPCKIAKKEMSKDGTAKFLFDLDDQEKIETVFIPATTRATVCVSTQAGCKFGCKFCASGIGGWKRNLSAVEILTQILYVKAEAQRQQKSLSHIVFMGTGEPLDNYDNLMKAVRVINSPKGLNIAARRITISTCGLVPKIKKLGEEGLQVELAVSLHGSGNEMRDPLMPVNKKYPVSDLIAACREYNRATGRQITFEYILIKDVTCTDKAAVELGRLLKGLLCKVNLIPYNPVPEFDYEAPSRNRIFAFKNQLERSGIHATLRTPRGKDVSAACGQLRHAV